MLKCVNCFILPDGLWLWAEATTNMVHVRGDGEQTTHQRSYILKVFAEKLNLTFSRVASRFNERSLFQVRIQNLQFVAWDESN